jgi:hypothetical protein
VSVSVCGSANAGPLASENAIAQATPAATLLTGRFNPVIRVDITFFLRSSDSHALLAGIDPASGVNSKAEA